jgi:alkanesulfonate monooxygenase SsuD/methylene tetrahydromethanopterin reductase-like flavin-dependent oxidoreductase (luciferase family)
MDAGVHLALIGSGGEGFSQRLLTKTADAARDCGFPVLAAAAERSGPMKLVTTVALATLRGPVPLGRRSARDSLSGSRMIAGLGPGSSKAGYQASGDTRRSYAGGSASARRQSARSCCPAMPAQAADGSISGRWATSGARLS